MKYLTNKQRFRQIRLTSARFRKKIKRKLKRLLEKKSFIGLLRLIAPEKFSLENPNFRSKLLKFLEIVRTLILVEKRSFLIDFTQTDKLVAGGALLFYAELSRSLALAESSVIVRCKPPRNAKVAQALKQVGVLSLLKCNKKIVPSFRDVIHWKYATGHHVDGTKYENILGAYDGKVADALLDSLFRGISEAMTNCHHHAYLMPRKDGLGVVNVSKTWWMFSQEKDGFLSVVFCDLGVGIPETLPIQKPGIWQQVLTLGKAGSDSETIKYAIEDAVTRTGKNYRGKGLKQLLDAVEEHKSGALRIFSNFGCYTYHDEKVRLRDYADSIMGTLISWRIPIIQGSQI